jgi:hypothetical protein
MDDEFEGRTPARKFQKIDILILGFNLLDEVFAAVSDAFTSLTTLTAAHANYNVQREQFRQDATLEIETITGDADE